jgi:predicted enzyme related to lactoylglutathione lyase
MHGGHRETGCIEFPAIDIARAKKFYSDVFAWKFPYQPQR